MMKRLLLTVLALLGATPAAAEDAYEWTGLWEGTVGTLPVRACLEGYPDRGTSDGSYYYLSRLDPISLSDDGGEDTWTERAPGSDAEALWEFEELDSRRASGTWRQGARRLRFELHPIAWTESEWGGPCASPEFMAPRLKGGTVASGPAELAGWSYIRRSYRPPAHFADEVSIESFSYPPSRPGDAAINAALGAHLPSGSADDAFADCFAGAISSLGYDGDFEETLQPVMVSDAFLTVQESSGGFCGGAHPNYSYRYLTFDRESGAELEPFTWLNDHTAVEHHPAEDGLPDYFTVRPALRDLILSRDPADDLPTSEGTEEEPFDQECREAAEEQEFWTAGVSRSGMLFIPSMPHVLTPCAATFTVPWADLTPFLNEEGKAGLARLRGG